MADQSSPSNRQDGQPSVTWQQTRWPTNRHLATDKMADQSSPGNRQDGRPIVTRQQTRWPINHLLATGKMADQSAADKIYYVRLQSKQPNNQTNVTPTDLSIIQSFNHGRVVKIVGHHGHDEAMEAGGREFRPVG